MPLYIIPAVWIGLAGGRTKYHLDQYAEECHHFIDGDITFPSFARNEAAAGCLENTVCVEIGIGCNRVEDPERYECKQ